MNSLLLALESELVDGSTQLYTCPVVSVVAFCTHKYLHSDVPIFMERRTDNVRRFLVRTHIQGNWLEDGGVTWQDCHLPAVAPSENGEALSAGLCASMRRLAQNASLASSHPFLHPQGILGFRCSCLQAPSEASPWTKFCEVEAVEVAERTITALLNYERPLFAPKSLVHFEKVLREPPRLHNGRRFNLLFDEKVGRSFAEGPYFTLADLLLYPSFRLAIAGFSADAIIAAETHLPLTFAWIRRIEALTVLSDIISYVNEVCEFTLQNIDKVDAKDIEWSPWSMDVLTPPENISSGRRTFAHDEEVDEVLQLVPKDSLLELSEIENISTIEWSLIPPGANPCGGHLPDKRAPRKFQQLQNLAAAVLKIAQPGYRIVDFCSGGGHLGILLAHLLPNCDIVLLENKERSLRLAQKRVKDMQLKNVVFIQCNLDFFIGRFDVGIALHACGPATDLVLENCIERKAAFVVCPCCYGSLRETDRLRYPRSTIFSNVPMDCYFRIGRSADQSHLDHPMEERGVKCMTIIDSDRAHHAKSKGYNVILSRLKPISCTPKNMLLIGMYNIVK